MPLNRIKELIKDNLNDVNQLIISNLSAQVGLIEDLSQHIVHSGGKRLRPMVALLGAHACGYKGKNHILSAAAVEYFHTATLLHDDVLDESSLRRGAETANEIWGSKASILVGDYLLTQSMQLMVETGSLKALSVLTDTAHRITRGEVKQLINKGQRKLSTEDYFDIIHSKTSLLFSASGEVAAHLSESDSHLIDALKNYGLHLGNAFQITDDILDYCGLSESSGKNCGDDLKDGKQTLPLIYALERSCSASQTLIYQSLESGSTENLEKIQAILEDTGAIEECYKIASQEGQKATSALTPFPASPYKQALAELALFAVQRGH
jgi:octaprenyl-diphosphate synthase